MALLLLTYIFITDRFCFIMRWSKALLPKGIIMANRINTENYLSLSQSEQQVINFINDNVKDISSLSITTIASKTYTSLATVSRAIRKCGYDGIAHLRYSLKQDDMQEAEDIHIMNDILAKSYRECTRTIDNISIPHILRIISYIMNSRRTFLYARGYTALVAEEFAHHLVCLGYNAFVMKDSVVMGRTDMIMNPDDLMIVISVRNTTPELYESAKMAKAMGARVVTCCCVEGTNLESVSDVTIIGYAENVVDSLNVLSASRVSLSIICHVIIDYLSKTS